MRKDSQDYELNVSENGLRVATHNMPYVESVVISFIVKVGSRYESLEHHGMCHFLEHMAFSGTKKRSAKDIASDFDSIGAYFNAYTSREYTLYYAKVLKEHIEKAVEIISDIIQNSVFNENDIKKEYSVICQEIAASEDSPDELVFDKLLQVCFQDQSLGRSILGTTESISRFKKDDFNNYVDSYYNTGNVIVSFAGNIKHSESIKLTNKYLRSLGTGVNHKPNNGIYQDAISVINKDLEQTNFVIGYKGLGYKDIPNVYYANILSILFGGSMSSRLFQSIREKLGYAYSIGSFSNSYSDTGLFCIYGGTSHDNLYKCISKTMEEIEKIKDGILESEFEIAKSQIKSSMIMSLEKNIHKSEEIGKSILTFGRSKSVDEILSEVNEITLDDIKKSSITIFESKPSISIVGSKIDQQKIYKLMNK